MSLEKREIRLKTITTGESSVGKTSLQNRFHSNCMEQPICGIGCDFHSYRTEKVIIFPFSPLKELHINVLLFLLSLCNKWNVKLNIQFWDTAGQERFRCFTHSWYRNSQGITFVYDITNRNSFEKLQYWLDDLHKITPTPNAIKVIVGNKCDLEEKREVSYSEGLEFAIVNGCKFYETSAKTGINVKEMYNELINDIVEVI